MSEEKTPGQAAYEAYVMAAPDDLNFCEWEHLERWEQDAIDAGAQEAYEVRAAQQPQPAPELAAELDQLRDRLAALAASLDADALATQPSKKSQIQADAARRIREALA